MTTIRSGLVIATTAAIIIGSVSSALADYQPTAAQRSACMGDTLRLCSSEIPNTGRIINCLARQKSKVSAGCRVFFDRAGI